MEKEKGSKKTRRRKKRGSISGKEAGRAGKKGQGQDETRKAWVRGAG